MIVKYNEKVSEQAIVYPDALIYIISFIFFVIGIGIILSSFVNN